MTETVVEIDETKFQRFEEFQQFALDDLMLVTDVTWKRNKKNSFRVKIQNESAVYQIKRGVIQRYEVNESGELLLVTDTRKIKEGTPVTVKFTDAMGEDIDHVIVWDIPNFEKIQKQLDYGGPFQHRFVVKTDINDPLVDNRTDIIWEGTDLNDARKRLPKRHDPDWQFYKLRQPTRMEAKMFDLGIVEEPPHTADRLYEGDMNQVFPFQPVDHSRHVESDVMLVRLDTGELQLIRINPDGDTYRIIDMKTKRQPIKESLELSDLKKYAISSWWCVTNVKCLNCKVQLIPTWEYYDPTIDEFVECADPR